MYFTIQPFTFILEKFIFVCVCAKTYKATKAIILQQIKIPVNKAIYCYYLMLPVPDTQQQLIKQFLIKYCSDTKDELTIL